VSRRRWLGALAVVVAVPWAGAVGASAASPDRVGWWYKAVADPALAGVVPAPPNVPSGGLYVANDPSGPAAVAAVAFTGSGQATLTLAAAGQPGFSAETPIAACPSATVWTPSSAGAWAERPEYDCDRRKVDGTPAADGTTITWQLPADLADAEHTFNVVLVPQGQVPFQVALAPPGEDAVAAGEPDAATAATDDGAVTEGATEPDAAFTDPGTFTPDTGSSGSGSFTFAGGDVPASEPALAPGQADPAAPAAVDPDRTQPVGRQEVALPVPRALAVDRDATRGERIMAVAVLAALGLGLWFLADRPTRVPRLLGSLGGEVPLAAAEDGPVRGIGRFARPREAPPHPL
jgi:hypothetical protein